MKDKTRSSFLVILLSLILISQPVLGAQAPGPVAPQAPAPGQGVPEPPKEVRDQDLLVPTPKGVQRATKAEFDKVKELEKKKTDQLIGAYVVGDYSSGDVLMAQNADQVVGMASTSKLMTLYVAMDAVKAGKINLKDPVTIDHEAASLSGSSYKTKENEVYTVEELIHAGLIVSGNDAMIALAKHVAGSQEAFVAMMNQKAKDLGLTNAHFVNAHGLTDYQINDFNKMTSHELFVLTCHLLRDHPELLDISKRTCIKEEGRNFTSYNTNPLLGIVPQVDGLKTGYTNAAGRCLVATALRPEEGDKKATRLIGVFMNSPDDWSRFVGSKRLMEEAIERFSYEVIAKPKDSVDILSLEDASPSQVPVYPAKSKLALLDSGKYFREEVSFDPIDLPIKKGGQVGRVKYYLGDEMVHETALVVHEDVRKPNPILHLKDKIRKTFYQLDSIVDPGHYSKVPQGK